MRGSDHSKIKAPANLARVFLLALLFPGGRRGMLGSLARTILYLLIAMVLVFLIFWAVVDSTTR